MGEGNHSPQICGEPEPGRSEPQKRVLKGPEGRSPTSNAGRAELPLGVLAEDPSCLLQLLGAVSNHWLPGVGHITPTSGSIFAWLFSSFVCLCDKVTCHGT